MHKLLLSFVAMFSAFSVSCQTVVATFDSLYLSGPDTAYISYFNPGNDVGFDNGGLHFPTVYDTLFGLNFWSRGFAYTNETDTVTSGYTNQYAAKAGSGYNGTSQYATAYGEVNYAYYEPTGKAKNIGGFYVTNNTYAYNSMRDGDNFAKKFGGLTGADEDWFRLTVVGIVNSLPQTDSVHFYLADFRDTNSANDYIVDDWQWVDLTSLGNVDTLMFILKSTDTSSFGLNTPAYFCIDNFTTHFTTSLGTMGSTPMAKVFPNPATSSLIVEVRDNSFNDLFVFDMNGRLLGQYEVKKAQTSIPTGHLSPGSYLLQLSSDTNKASVWFIKQ